MSRDTHATVEASNTLRNEGAVLNSALSQTNEGPIYFGTVNNYTCSHEATRTAFSRRYKASGYNTRYAARNRVLNSLRFTRLEAREHTIEDAHLDTCGWLLRHDMFQEWLNIDTSSRKAQKFLWLKGKPGAGKSTIMKHVYNSLKRDGDCVVIAFFFNARGSNLEKSTQGLYRSLLYQLLGQIPALQTILDDIDLGHDPSANEQWPRALLEKLLKDALDLLGDNNVIFMIDALDECPTSDVRDMVDLFDDVLCATTSQLTPRLKLCLSSRHYPHINIKNGIEITLESQKEHEDDIRSYIESRISYFDLLEMDELRETILLRSSGIFLWVILVVKILRDEYEDGNVHTLQERLDNTPQRLEELLEQIVDMGHGVDRQFVLCMQWVLFAEQPLTVSELYWALLSRNEDDLNRVVKNKRNLPQIGTMRRFALSSSRGLLEEIRGSERIQFIHESVREFFLNRSLENYGFPGRPVFISSSHNSLKLCCLHYINFAWRAVRDEPPGHPTKKLRELSIEWISEQFKASFGGHAGQTMILFLRHATQGVLFHGDAADRAGSCQYDFVSSLPSMAWSKTQAQIGRTGFYPAQVGQDDMAYVLADYSHVHLLKHALKILAALETSNTTYLNPLTAAILRQNKEIIATILEITAEYQLQQIFGTIIKPLEPNLISKTADVLLEWRLDIRSASALIRTVLGVGPNEAYGVNDPVPEYEHTLLTAAARIGATRSIELLLDSADADINATDKLEQTPLCVAIQAGKIDAVYNLMQRKDIDLNRGSAKPPRSRSMGSMRPSRKLCIGVLTATGKYAGEHVMFESFQIPEGVKWSPLVFILFSKHDRTSEQILHKIRPLKLPSPSLEEQANLARHPLFLWAYLRRAIEYGLINVVESLLGCVSNHAELASRDKGSLLDLVVAKRSLDMLVCLLNRCAISDFGSNAEGSDTPDAVRKSFVAAVSAPHWGGSNQPSTRDDKHGQASDAAIDPMIGESPEPEEEPDSSKLKMSWVLGRAIENGQWSLVECLVDRHLA